MLLTPVSLLKPMDCDCDMFVELQLSVFILLNSSHGPGSSGVHEMCWFNGRDSLKSFRGSLLPPLHVADDIAACRSHADARHTRCLSTMQKHVSLSTDKTCNQFFPQLRACE